MKKNELFIIRFFILLLIYLVLKLDKVGMLRKKWRLVCNSGVFVGYVNTISLI